MTVETPKRSRIPAVGYHEPDPKYMTFVEHLDELRRRLIVCVVAIAVGSVGGWFLFDRVLTLLKQPLCKELPKHCTLYVDQIYGLFTLQLKTAVTLGFMFALPITLWQLWLFVAPAFGPKANRWGPVWIFSAIALFLAGVAVGYFVIPLAIKFFGGFQGHGIGFLLFASNYIGFITLVLLVFGISFELPLALVSLSAAGITSSAWLASKRMVFFFGIFIFATVATPGADWISPLILGSILYVLYEISILVSRAIGK
ncbi:MAG: hypothetical protein NVS2B16_06250 [Chloroflexota bacterium]